MNRVHCTYIELSNYKIAAVSYLYSQSIDGAVANSTAKAT